MATIKQKKAFDKVLENGGNVSRAMMDTGYTVATAKTPKKLTTSKGWQELMDEHLPDKLLATKHLELLNSEREEIATKSLDMAYKLKGSYAAEKTTSLNVNVEADITDKSELNAIREDYEKKIKEQLSS